MLAWSAEEAGRILETYKTLEDKPPDLIMEKNNPDPHSKLVEALTSVKSVNKTDAATLIGAFGTMEGIVAASIEDLSMCPGMVSSVMSLGFETQLLKIFFILFNLSAFLTPLSKSDETRLVPSGFGPQKAQRLHKVLHEPFKRK